MVAEKPLRKRRPRRPTQTDLLTGIDEKVTALCAESLTAQTYRAEVLASIGKIESAVFGGADSARGLVARLAVVEARQDGVGHAALVLLRATLAKPKVVVAIAIPFLWLLAKLAGVDWATFKALVEMASKATVTP